MEKLFRQPLILQYNLQNVNDIHNLIVVTKNIVQDAYDINEISNIFDALYNESGEYNIKVEDRMGNNYTITI